ncbi:MAG: tetratricopeptide repeat-containing glycosyltransferase family protein, partial [Bdellovibrionales bacterium]
ALCYVHERNFDEALRHAHAAVACASEYGEGWRTLCNIAEQVGDYELARVAGEKCVRLMPSNHFAWFGYGVAMSRLHRFEEALEAYKRALALKPDRADIWDNLGQTYQSLNKLDEAEATFLKTVEVAGQIIPNEDSREVEEEEYGNRHWHLALIELLRGKYKSGFARYRARFQDVGGLRRVAYSRPLWKGEDLSGKTILISDEQGFGDTLMLYRYIPLLKKRGARIKLAVHPALAALFREGTEADEVLVHDVATGEYDFHASVFDLPYRFGTTLDSVPSNIPYLPQLEPDDATRLPQKDQEQFRVGVVWGGSPLHKNDANRSIPLADFREIFAEGGARVSYYSFNRDMKAGDAELLPHLNITDLAPLLTDFAASARLIRQMALVVTCDTATAHLAGGLGKKVWTLLPFAPDWRWLSDRSDSVWYPTMRLFRQPRHRDWKTVIREVRYALKTAVQNGNV